MDVGTLERGIVIRVNGDGNVTVSHEGVTPIEAMGLLAMAQVWLMDDLGLRERPQEPTKAHPLDMLKRLREKAS